MGGRGDRGGGQKLEKIGRLGWKGDELPRFDPHGSFLKWYMVLGFMECNDNVRRVISLKLLRVRGDRADEMRKKRAEGTKMEGKR